jgi:uncharacterized repeat protein (TIGR03803 family)
MPTTPDVLRLVVSSGLACVIWTTFGGNAAIASEKVLYAFEGGSDGAVPYGGLISDNAGNLYGTTSGGGSGTGCPGNCGTVFKVTPDGTENVLYSFQGGSDGAGPIAGLIADSAGNYYGTTSAGGAADAGTVFELAPDGTETVLYPFKGGSDGGVPWAGLIMDSARNLYGTTEFGGNMAECNRDGCGTVFKVTPSGAETVLYSFCSQTNCSDGSSPVAGLIMDSEGNFYGTTGVGGTGSCSGFPNCGTVFKVTPDGTETVLYSFHGGSDGALPEAGLIADNNGNFYGTTAGGGGCAANGNCGTVFKFAPDGTETVLYAFQGGSDGNIPEAGVIMDTFGNLFGTTYSGGGTTKCHRGGCGTVFKLAPDGRETVLFAFGNGGRFPAAGLLAGPHGLLYGTATAGGAGHDGVVFHVKKRRTK